MLTSRIMEKKYFLLSFLLAFILAFAPACAREPRARQSAKIIQKYFNKYGKKYRETAFASGVKNIDVTNQDEIHKNLVAVQAFITMNDGSVQRINATVERGPIGWRFVSWENDSNM